MSIGKQSQNLDMLCHLEKEDFENDPSSHKEDQYHRSEVGVQKVVYFDQMCKMCK